MTPLEDSFSCNFNILIGGTPRVLGVKEILLEWNAFRAGCVRRGIYFDLQKKKDRLHLLEGLQKILLDIDRAIEIIRHTEDDKMVVPNLMIGFGIDETQAEFVAEIKLRNLNQEYILNKTAEIDKLKTDIADYEDILQKPVRVKKIIIAQLQSIIKKYGKPRMTQLLYEDEIEDQEPLEEAPDYPVTLFMTKQGYFKKVTAQSLRMSGEHKLKEGDELFLTLESTNRAHLLVFTDKQQVYKARVSDFADTKISLLGDYLPQALQMQEGEQAVFMAATTDYAGYLLVFFKNGKCAKVEMNAYQTKLNRKKLIHAYSAVSEPVAMFHIEQDGEFVLTASNNRTLIADSRLISPKTTKDTAGVHVMTLKSKTFLDHVTIYQEGMFEQPSHYRTKNLPAAGSFLRDADDHRQLMLQ